MGLANQYLMPLPILNFMLSGMVYSAVFANILDEEKLESVMQSCTPVVNACFTLIILNLGALVRLPNSPSQSSNISPAGSKYLPYQR